MCETETTNTNNFSLLNIATPKFLDAATTPAAKEIGDTLGNIFHVIFYPFNRWSDKLRLKHQAELKAYATDIEQELNKIPVDNLLDPPIDVVGPALEASKYYINHDDIRKMFAKLIAASMNSDTQDLAHHSFVEIIKQLSPHDAAFAKLFIETPDYSIPVGKYIAHTYDEKTFVIRDNILRPISCSNKSDVEAEMLSNELDAISLTNLLRLGIVERDSDYRRDSFDDYLICDDFFYSELNDFISGISNTETFFFPEYIPMLDDVSEIEVSTSVYKLTAFGTAFMHICCSE